MKILHLYKDYFPIVGGIENHVRLLAEAEAARGHDVTVIVNSLDARTRAETRNGVRVIYAARLFTISSTPISLAYWRAVAQTNADIAHLHFPYPWGELANYFFGRARRVVITYHSDIIRQKFTRALYAPLMWRVLARADKIIATSPNYIRSSRVLQKFAEKCAVVPLGITLAPIERAVDRVGAKHASPLQLLFVGHLRYYKGVDFLLRALVEIPRAQLTIIGTGPLERAWKNLARELRVENRVRWLGAVRDEELIAQYAACDIFVLPASERSEAFGVAQLEAMAAGKPIVCTEIGTGTSFVNVDGETGFVVPSRDSRALARAIARLLDDASLRARMGAAARARVQNEFTVDKMVAGIENVYAELLRANNSSTSASNSATELHVKSDTRNSAAP
ncbi:MAG: glycosyltransferase [Chloroflexi bacterium]|nr:glycosyltransferase [Chloroflexota bacterium]